MPRTVMIFAMVVVAVHGLIHLMGFVAYWPLAEVKDLPYKTALWGGQWEVGPSGMRVFSVLWLLAAIGYAVAVAGFFLGQAWWRPLVFAATALSIPLTILDWETAFRGTIVDVIILAGLLLTA